MRLHAARNEIPRRPTRSRTNLDRLVAGLDAILEEYNGEGISRSNKRGRDSAMRFVVAVVRIADSTVGHGSLDEAMKSAISNRRNSR